MVEEVINTAFAEGRMKQGVPTARGVTPTTSIRLDPADIEKARAVAAKRGLRYQTYLKMLIHEALQRETVG
jgi:predicted DNA binding CopG/RHH family protein